MSDTPIHTARSWFWLVALLVLAMLLGACGGAPAGNTPASTPNASDATAAAPAQSAGGEAINLRMTIWTGNADQLALFNGIAESYRATHPNVSVTFDTIPFDDYTSKLTIQLAGGNPPDAGWILETTAPTFIDANVLVDLAPTLKGSADYKLDDFSKTAMQLWTRGDSVYGVPLSTSPFILFYNSDLFKAAGLETPTQLAAKNAWTWDAFASAAKTIAVKNPGTYGFESVDGSGYTSRIWHTLVPIIRAYGSDAWNGSQCTLSSPQAVQAVQLYHSMIFSDKSVVPPGEQGDFFTGKSAMTVGQLSRVSKLKDATFAWDIAPLPSGPAGTPYVIGQAAIGVFGAGAHKDVAADFVAFMTNQENTAKLAQFFPPARASVLGSDAMSKANPKISASSLQSAVISGIEKGQVLPSAIEFPKIDLAARAEFDKLWTANADVQATLNGVCDVVTPLLGSN